MRDRRDKPYRNYTFDPWPCCQAEAEGYGGRPKTGVICEECRLLMTLGKSVRAKADSDRKAGERQPYWFVEQPHAYPYISTPSRHGHDQGDRLRKAFYDLVWALGDQADGQPRESPIRRKPKPRHGSEFEPWPEVIDNDSLNKSMHHYDWRKLIVLRPVLRDLINGLDAAARDAIAEAFQAGKREGAAILFGLASGEKSLADFDLALLTPEERAEAERKRRGY